MRATGSKLGQYEIVGPLGAGGMGEVYRGRDAKLGRDVALKVLPEAFARDAERMARFQREAKVLASFNHPNIASVYGFEDSGPTHALVMELVEGPTLAGHIKSGESPIEEVLGIAKQICDALEYAHERGIVHRSETKQCKDDERRSGENSRFWSRQSVGYGCVFCRHRKFAYDHPDADSAGSSSRNGGVYVA